MRTVRAEHEIACTPEVFWKLFFDQEFNRELYLTKLQFEAFEVLEQTETTRKVRVVPKLSMPKAVMKLTGDKFSYVEQGTFDAAQGVWTWEVIPSVLQGKITNQGTLRVVPAGEGRCRRIDEMQVEAKVFGVGGVIESSTEKQVTSAWDDAAAFTEEWIRRHAG